MEHSRRVTEKAAARDNSEVDYLASLRKANTQPGFKIETEASTEHLKEIKEKINKIVKQEIAKLEFKDKLAAEQLEISQYNEVISKSNFYFGIDENKKSKNVRISNFNAPGNKYKKP